MLQNHWGPVDGFGVVAVSARACAVLTRQELWNAVRAPIEGERKRCAEPDRLKGCRLLEARRSQEGVKFWIVTEADRSRSTVMLPGESLTLCAIEG